MKFNVLLLTLSLVTILGACQKPGQHVGKVSQNETPQGPGDGGGGDTCNGKMIESYRVEIQHLEEYKQYVAPIMKRVFEDDRTTKSEAEFQFSSLIKNWYIIDCKLQEIPKERKGLFMETDQTAIHTNREIFIFSGSYNKMSLEEKAKLLLHEIVMGLYLMKYQTIEEICKMSNECSEDMIQASGWKMFHPIPYRALNSDDHQKIRSITAWLWENGKTSSIFEVKKYLLSNGFDERFYDPALDSNENSVEVHLSPDKLIEILKKHHWSKSFPEFCGFDSTNSKSESKCRTEAQVRLHKKTSNSSTLIKKEISIIQLNLKIVRLNDQKTIEREFYYPLVKTDGTESQSEVIRLHQTRIGPLKKIAPLFFMSNWPNFESVSVDAIEGHKSSTLLVFFDLRNSESPGIFKMVVQDYVWYGTEEVIDDSNAPFKAKILYGKIAPLEDEKEILFFENELLFNFDIHFPDRHMIQFELIKPSSR